MPPTPSAAAWKSSRRACWARFAKSTSGWTAVVRPAGTTTPRPTRFPPELNWDFWCGPSKVLPFKNHYLGFCLNWGPWLEFGDGHLADMGAHGLNLPWRALKLGTALNCSTKVPEPVKDSYPSATDISWDFAARGDMPEVKLWWHDGGKGPPEELGKELVSTYNRVPGNGVLFAGDKGILCSDCWGVGGVVKLKGEAKCRGVHDHEACKPVPITLPRVPGQFHIGEWLRPAKAVPRRSRASRPPPWSPRSPWWACSPCVSSRA